MANRALGNGLQQLTLPVHLRDEATLENFLPGDSLELMLAALQQQVRPAGEAFVYLHGGEGTGKSHLLQASCHLAGERALYLPLAELADFPPAEVLRGIERMDLVCLDDLDCATGDPGWEMALFNFYNLAREHGCRLLVAAQAAPRALAVGLDDLRSRLAWGTVYHLPAPSDERRIAILKFRAARRGLVLPDEVARYVVSRAPRAMQRLVDLLDELDRASLSHQRALSIPFVKQALHW